MRPIKRRALTALMERSRPSGVKVMQLLEAICRDRGYVMEYQARQNLAEFTFRLEVTIETRQNWQQVEAALIPLQRLVKFNKIGFEERWEDQYAPFGRYSGLGMDMVWPRRRRHLGFKYSLEAAFVTR